MRRDVPLTPWPRLRQTWWVYALALALVGLQALGLVLRLRCSLVGRCAGVLPRVFDMDALGGLPRLAITALFAATAVLAWRAARRQAGRAATWWTALAVIAGALTVAKLVSVHAAAKAWAPVPTLVACLLLAAAALVVLGWLGRRRGVPATGPVVLALALYVAAALGLDALTGLAAAVQTRSGALTAAAATFVEELGEGLAALVVLVTVRWQAAAVAPAPAAVPVPRESGRTPEPRARPRTDPAA
jgi:hypothetical protein